ncbi:hypothetical protein SLS62_006228 [Diatrype stigma]|uniref:Uncharacterized protein n=1 Tax=Diatrype stigma TaxID=117547 RepID=A0AAN9YMV8_9PEZI
MPQIRESLGSTTFRLNCPPIVPPIQNSEHLDPYLREILLDTLDISYLINNRLRSGAFDLVTFQEMQVSIGYRLFQFSSLGSPRHECAVQAAYHVGLTIFLMTMFLQFDHRRMMDYDLISLRLKDVLGGGLDRQDESGLLLWLTLIGGIWVSRDAHREWLGPKLRREAQRLGLESWDKALDVISKFPWVHTLHDEPGHTVWDIAHSRGLVPLTRPDEVVSRLH